MRRRNGDGTGRCEANLAHLARLLFGVVNLCHQLVAANLRLTKFGMDAGPGYSSLAFAPVTLNLYQAVPEG